MKKIDYEKYTTSILLSAIIYMLLDLSVRMTGFLEFGSYIGIKNFLPATLGLLLGWCGMLGCLMGSILSSIITSAPLPELLFEATSVFALGTGMWLIWHIGAKSRRVHLKKAEDYFRYSMLVVLLSAVCGMLSYVFLPGGAFLKVFIADSSMNLLVGIPVIILLTSTVCVIPILPPWCTMAPDVNGSIHSDPGSLDCFNELLEEYAVLHKINRKSLFGVQNCIEEVVIRIFAAQPDAIVTIKIYFDDSFSLWFEYQSGRYNPFMTGRYKRKRQAASLVMNEEAEDMFGLQLIKHRALRESFKYRRGNNQIHIVI